MRATGLGQSLEGIKAIASIGGAAIVLWIVYEFAGVVLEDAHERAPGGGPATQMYDWFQAGLDLGLPVMFIGLIFFGLVATAIIARTYR